MKLKNLTSNRNAVKAVAISVILLALSIPGSYLICRYVSGRTAVKKANVDISRMADAMDEHQISRVKKAAMDLSLNVLVMDVLKGKSEADNQAVQSLLQGAKSALQASIVYLMNPEGTVVACSRYGDNKTLTGKNYKFRPYFSKAIKGEPNLYAALGATTGKRGLYFGMPVYEKEGSAPVGVMVIKSALSDIDQELASGEGLCAMVSPEGVIFASNHDDLLYRAITRLPDTTREEIIKSRQFGGHKLEPVSADILSETNSFSVSRSLPLEGWRMIMWRKADEPYAAATVSSMLAALVILLCGSLYVMNILNVEKRKQMEAELRQAQKLESVGQLAAGIAHEINTPVQFVSNNIAFMKGILRNVLDYLQDVDDLIEASKLNMLTPDMGKDLEKSRKAKGIRFLKEEFPDAIEQSIEGLERISSIVHAMKEFSHPGVDNMVEADINKAINTTITVARNEWKHRAKLETDFDRTLPRIPCLAGELNQVILNLIINACDAIDEANGADGSDLGVIKMSTRGHDGHAVITISDSGKGIDPEILHRVFDPFFTTKDVGKGTGQGLAIARSVIVDKHKGDISVDSKPGEGTTFTIRLPMRGRKHGKN